MGNVLNRKPKVGDMLRYIGVTNDYVTHDKIYVVQGVDDEGDPFIFDDDGDHEYVRPQVYANYHLVETALTDPGYIDINIRNPIDITGEARLDVIVDERGLKTLLDLERTHQRAKARARIEAQIKELEDELKKI